MVCVLTCKIEAWGEAAESAVMGDDINSDFKTADWQIRPSQEESAVLWECTTEGLTFSDVTD